ncbi:VOC family protein [Streptacidiphilus rugosus]|uniref:VOC family protein n=1 Tax=Streptacidiphilus rugosus TaxID=405783 RepID=UPI000B06E588|nr:VOC family protein [Streptacidiphilus rugosus]
MEIPQHHRQAVVPHIMVDGAAEAIAFYEAAFGAVEHLRLERADGGISHAEIAVAGSTLMLSDADSPDFAAPGPA